MRLHYRREKVRHDKKRILMKFASQNKTHQNKWSNTEEKRRDEIDE